MGLLARSQRIPAKARELVECCLFILLMLFIAPVS